MINIKQELEVAKKASEVAAALLINNNMDTAMNFLILTELQMYTLLVMLTLKAELVAYKMSFTG